MYLASKSFSSMKEGARQPAQTTKISAEANLEAFGLVASTRSKNFLKTHIRDWKSVERKTFVTKQPPSRKKEHANLRAARTNQHCELASLLQLAPTLGAPSFRTTSHFCPLVSFLSCSQHCAVVISPWKLVVPGTLLIGSKSTPTMVEFIGMHQLATCIHPPGAAQRSMRTLAVLRKLYLRLSWISLQAALERQPCCLAQWQQVSSLFFDFVFLPIRLLIYNQLVQTDHQHITSNRGISGVVLWKDVAFVVVSRCWKVGWQANDPYFQKMSEPESVFWGYAKPFLVGSMSGSVASSVIQPIDTIKVVIQNRREAAGKNVVNLSPFFVGREIVQQNGVIGLYKGLDSAILRQFVYCGIRLGLFKVLEDRVKEKEKRNLTFGEKIFYSLFTGAFGSVIANPTDMALIRFQSDNSLPAAERRNYKNVFDALGRIYKEQGVAGLWRGSIPTIARAMAVNCSHLVGYNESKEQLLKFTGEKKETMTIRLTASAISGVAVSLCSLPFDNVKTKVLKMKKNAAGEMPYKGFVDCFAKSIKNEGFFGLWVGLPTFYSRMAPHAMITVLLQDFFHDLLSKKNAN